MSPCIISPEKLKALRRLASEGTDGEFNLAEFAYKSIAVIKKTAELLYFRNIARAVHRRQAEENNEQHNHEPSGGESA